MDHQLRKGKRTQTNRRDFKCYMYIRSMKQNELLYYTFLSVIHTCFYQYLCLKLLNFCTTFVIITKCIQGEIQKIRAASKNNKKNDILAKPGSLLFHFWCFFFIKDSATF